MRLASCAGREGARVAVVTGDRALVLPAGIASSMLGLIAAGPESLLAAERYAADAAAGGWRPLEELALLAPIPVPRKNIICVGWNYADHAQESAAASGKARELPAHPVFFTKNVTSVNSPHGDIPAQPDVTSQLDWEVELGVIIGTGGRGIARGEALARVFGYTVINDVSARDLQFRHKQYFLGKSLDGSCPMGPVIVTADEIPDPQNLALRTWVNGELKQSASTAQQIFPVATLIETLSRGMPLEPGDIIATGTPSGVGFARQPPEFLRRGDIVECEVAGIGRLRNRII